MESIRKNRSLISIIIFLLLTNLAMLAFFIFFNKNDQGNTSIADKGRFYTALQKDVGFSDEQMNEYQALRKQNMQYVGPLFNEVKNAKFSLFDLVYTEPVPDSAIDSAATKIGQRQKELDIQMFHYFKKVRKVCKNQQLPKFDTAVKQLVIRMISKPGKPDKK
ncbi:MAG: hypothetical protein ABIR19_10360 [Ginsengibacter sp.]